MNSFVRMSVGAALCVAACGCGGSQARAWRGSRYGAGVYAPAGQSVYVPPVEPPPSAPSFQSAPAPAPEPDVAPAIPPRELEPRPTPAPLRLDEALPPPPSEDEESVQFLYPAPPSSMPNVLYPEETRPLLEQSSAERPIDRQMSDLLGEGKIALRMRGHSTYVSPASKSAPLPQADRPAGSLMQVQYVPVLAPVPVL